METSSPARTFPTTALTPTMSAPSILVIGSTGRLGLQLIKNAASHPSKPAVHAFARTPSKLPSDEEALCASVIQGDARKSPDIRDALAASGAGVVVITVGIPNSTKPDDVREATARALMDVVQPGSEYAHVKVVVVSSTGAGGTKIEVGMGLGMIISFVLRHVMLDHDNQEKEFKTRMGEEKNDRLLIVRPTALTDGKEMGDLCVFTPSERAPTSKVDRADVASWIINSVCGSGKDSCFGKEVSLTKKK